MTDELYERDVEALAIALFAEFPLWPTIEAAARWMTLPDSVRELWRSRSRRLHEKMRALSEKETEPNEG